MLVGRETRVDSLGESRLLDLPVWTSECWAVHLLGRFDARAGDGRQVTPASRRTEELLSYLLLLRRPHHREALADMLWPESSTAQSRKYLRQSLWHLRTLGT